MISEPDAAARTLSSISESMLTNEASRLMNTGHRESTSKVYQTAKNSYIHYCKQYMYTPLPLKEDVMLKYVSYLSLKHLSSATVKVYCSGIRSFSIIQGFGLPSQEFHRLKLAIRSLDINTYVSNKKLPITLEILHKLIPHMSNSYNDIMLWAAMTLAHFGLLRSSEFTINTVYDPNVHLSWSDLSFHVSDDQIEYIKIHIKRSKTDHLNKGVYICIGCSKTQVCAYCAIRSYHSLHIRTFNKVRDPKPLLTFHNGVYLSRTLLITNLKMYLALAGIDPQQYSSHSFRIGGATSAAAAGLADWEIKILGRWTSDTYQRYIRTPTSTLVGFATRMTQKQPLSVYNFRNPYVYNVFGQ